MRILCGKFLNGCLGVFNWCEKGDFGWECVEMRDFERLFLCVGVSRVNFDIICGLKKILKSRRRNGRTDKS